jgi:RES domain-containing protein
MPRTWRLTTARFACTAFTGDGARRWGGRWNPKGRAVVYTAGNLSLAMLEMLVQDQPLRARYVAIPAEIPADLAIRHIRVDELPADWREPTGRDRLRHIGADWLARRETAVLAVPSTVIPSETNYLLNPAQADFERIGIGEPEPLVTDLRLLGRGGAAERCEGRGPRAEGQGSPASALGPWPLFPCPDERAAQEEAPRPDRSEALPH